MITMTEIRMLWLLLYSPVHDHTFWNDGIAQTTDYWFLPDNFAIMHTAIRLP